VAAEIFFLAKNFDRKNDFFLNEEENIG